jgi:hypothetical protein
MEGGPIKEPLYAVALHVLEALSQSELCFKDPRYVGLVALLGPYLKMYAAMIDWLSVPNLM